MHINSISSDIHKGNKTRITCQSINALRPFDLFLRVVSNSLAREMAFIIEIGLSVVIIKSFHCIRMMLYSGCRSRRKYLKNATLLHFVMTYEFRLCFMIFSGTMKLFSKKFYVLVCRTINQSQVFDMIVEKCISY